VIHWFFGWPRRAYALIAAVCVLMLAFALYLQHVKGIEPCPMCVVQRYALIGVMVFALIGALSSKRGFSALSGVLALLSCAGGAFTAARQSWMQWHPPTFASCGRDIYGMIEAFPLERVVPMIFRGSGDCSKVDWSLFGLSLANWSFIVFVVFALLCLALIVRPPPRRARFANEF
jgi:disulfide bond formation protein DsbB